MSLLVDVITATAEKQKQQPSCASTPSSPRTPLLSPVSDALLCQDASFNFAPGALPQLMRREEQQTYRYLVAGPHH